MSADRLKKLYLAMSEHTKDECANCLRPHSCCSPEYCEITLEWARTKWGVELERTDHPTLPLMGSSGCIAEPHLRPLCTLHTCNINSYGFKPDDDINNTWTNVYFNLRERITHLEHERTSDPHD